MEIQSIYKLFLDSDRKISIDSRKMPEGGLFFALRGENFDGNAFATRALEAGAAYAIVDDPMLKDTSGCIIVPDVLETLQQLAKIYRRQFTIPILGITGSNGKTTTKELVHRVLASHYSCGVTQGNLNNHIGVPLTLLGLEPDLDIAVVEMGANHQGEIAELCRIASPTHGLITNIGKAHLEGFGGISGVIKGKGELYDFLKNNEGVVFVNRDENHLEQMSAGFRRKIMYGSCQELPHSLYQVRLLATQPFLKLAFSDEQGELWTVQTHLTGEYNLANLMTAICVGQYFKVPEEKIATAIASYIPANNRSQILIQGSNKFLLDAYNANPSSMRKALESFASLPAEEKNKVAVIGDMLELGEYSAEEHRDMAHFALQAHFDQLILVGPAFEAVAKQEGIRHFDSTDKLKAWLSENPFENCFVLLKASRGIGLECILE